MRAFARSAAFFAQAETTKAQWPLARNAGWESRAQIRPSTGKADLKESYQVTARAWPACGRPRPSCPDFRPTPGLRGPMLGPGMRVLSCFADKLGMERDFFTRAHNPASPHYQSTLRMLRYFAPQPGQEPGAGAPVRTPTSTA
jgi:isopenicillin N synthase-like dioxygenase